MSLSMPTPHQLRDNLTAVVVRDLLGPAGGPEEEIDQREDHVYSRYLVGMLAPRGTEVEAEALDELAATEPDDEEAGATDSSVSAGHTFFPASMGYCQVNENLPILTTRCGVSIGMLTQRVVVGSMHFALT